MQDFKRFGKLIYESKMNEFAVANLQTPVGMGVEPFGNSMHRLQCCTVHQMTTFYPFSFHSATDLRLQGHRVGGHELVNVKHECLGFIIRHRAVCFKGSLSTRP